LDVKVKKGKAEHLYSTLHGITTLKRSGMDHTVLPAINTMPAFKGADYKSYLLTYLHRHILHVS